MSEADHWNLVGRFFRWHCFRLLQGLIKACPSRAAVVSYCRLLPMPFNRFVWRHDEGPQLAGLGVPVQSVAVAKVELRVGICAKPSVLRLLANWGQRHVNVNDNDTIGNT